MAVNPIIHAIDTLIAEQDKRHSWLGPASKQARRWKAEDAANGMPWDEINRGPGAAEKAARSNS